MKKHRDYEAIFTWSPGLVDYRRYFPISAVPRQFDPKFVISRDLSRKTGLVTMIAGNKKRSHPQELYSARLEAIKWYEANKPELFDLYGHGWDEIPIRGAERLRKLKLLNLLSQIIPPQPRPSYRGAVPNKGPVMGQYRFVFAYENIRDLEGYITEKIFDPMLASSVPIYWGAPDIDTFVPKDCFIDYRDYRDQSKLFERLSTMDDGEYIGYLERIEKFIRTQSNGPFGVRRFAETLVSVITNPRNN